MVHRASCTPRDDDAVGAGFPDAHTVHHVSSMAGVFGRRLPDIHLVTLHWSFDIFNRKIFLVFSPTIDTAGAPFYFYRPPCLLHPKFFFFPHQCIVIYHTYTCIFFPDLNLPSAMLSPLFPSIAPRLAFSTGNSLFLHIP